MIIVQVALRNLLQAKRRTALLGLAIALVTGMLVLLGSMSRGINDSLVQAATTLSAGHVNVAGFYKPTAGTALPILTKVDALEADLASIGADVAYIVERHRGWGKLVSETGAVQVGLTGIIPVDEARFFDRLQLAPESEYVEGGRDAIVGDARRLSEPDTIVVFVGHARRLGVRVGDVITITTETASGQTNTADVRIVAVARDLGFLSSFAVFVPKQVILDLYRLNEDTTGALWVYLDDISRSEEVMATFRQGLAERGYDIRDHEAQPFFFKFDAVMSEDWVGQQIDVTTWRDEVSFLTWIITGFDVVSGLLVGVLVVIIAVGIANAMWNAVRERTREIGTLRAIGMSRGGVLRLFLAEALLLGAGATSLGALVGALIAWTIDSAGIAIPNEAVRAILLSDTLHLVVAPRPLVVAVVVLTLITGLASLWPAIHAARLRPVQALSHAE